MNNPLNTIQFTYYIGDPIGNLSIIISKEHAEEFDKKINLPLSCSSFCESSVILRHGDCIIASYDTRSHEPLREIEKDVRGGVYPYLTLIESEPQ